MIFVNNDGMSKSEFLTGYEQRALKGWEKSKADQIKDGKMLEATLKKVLLHEIEEAIVLPTGEVANLPIIDLLVIKKVGYDLDHPEKINLKDYSNVLGETKQEVAVSTEDSVMELFKGVYNGSNSQQPSRSDT